MNASHVIPIYSVLGNLQSISVLCVPTNVVLALKRRSAIWVDNLDLVYSQSGTLYDLIPQAPHPSTDPAKPPTEVPIDGIVGSIQSPSTPKPAKQNQMTTPTPSTPKVSVEVNSIQSTQTLGNKKKGKNQNKKPGN